MSTLFNTCDDFVSCSIVRAFLIEEQKIVKKVRMWSIFRTGGHACMSEWVPPSDEVAEPWARQENL